MLIDRVTSATFQNGIIRVDCVAIGPNNEERPSGTLLIPANQLNPVLQSLSNAAKELDRLLREQVAQQLKAAEAAAPKEKSNGNHASKKSKGTE